MLTIQINGQSRTLQLVDPTTLSELLEHLAIKPDRVAIEHNGTIAPRTNWPKTPINTGDRIEIVHFVGGGFDFSE